MRLIDETNLPKIAKKLGKQDPHLQTVLDRHGPPPLWSREPGFATLLQIILEQQVSLKSAKAMLVRLEASIQPFTPPQFLELGDTYLRSLGVTRQKSGYLLDLSDSIVAGRLSFTKLARMSDEEARVVLTRIKGIGLWSADVYLLMAMRRADIWPAGDLALAVAMKELKGLAHRPGPIELEKLAEQWRPHRAVAARMLWQYYLGKKITPAAALRRNDKTS